MNDWYYAEGDQHVGPMDVQQLRAAIAAKDARELWVWRPGLAEWLIAADVPELRLAPPPLPKVQPRAQEIKYERRPSKLSDGQLFLSSISTKYADFKGRATRREFWLFNVPFLLLIAAFLVALNFTRLPLEGAAAFLVVLLALVIPYWAVAARRLHDADRSGAWLVLLFLPYIQPLVLVVIGCLRGTPGENRYGPDPRHA